MRALREALDQGESDAIREGTQTIQELAALNSHIEGHAKEFGEHIRNGGWRLGLLVALSVESGAGQGTRTDITSVNFDRGGKISAVSFARQAGNISKNTVGKYLTAWDLAAQDGHVPSSREMLPEHSYTFDNEVHTPELWKSYFKPVSEKKSADFCSRFNRSVSSLIDLDVFDIDPSLFDDGQLDFSPDDIYELASSGIRKLLKVQRRLESVAGQLGYQINKTPPD